MINRNGLVAMQHYTSNGWDVDVKENGVVVRTYNFRPKHNISMAWVKEEDVDKLLAIRVKACCNKKQNRFFLSSLINVNLWETGNRHGNLDE